MLTDAWPNQRKMLWNILLHCVKICHYDWFNKKLNCQELGRIFGAERMLGRRRQRSLIDTERMRHQTKRNRGKNHMVERRLTKVWVDLSYKGQLETSP